MDEGTATKLSGLRGAFDAGEVVAMRMWEMLFGVGCVGRRHPRNSPSARRD